MAAVVEHDPQTDETFPNEIIESNLEDYRHFLGVARVSDYFVKAQIDL